ncbi:MAG: polyprenyl synthetase family protein [Oscillospiraceae bacterium]|nr:polyprenyl synthetase family protein [Oscillospiraceae bacterium]
MRTSEFNEKLKNYANITERELDRLVPDVLCDEKSVIKAMRYSLLGAGKRLRAALLLECCIAAGGSVEQALPFACAVEMVHAYSLIHDDLPCMDDDDLRRGKPSCHIAFGESTALLAGDALLTKAFSVIMSSNSRDEVKVKAAAFLAECAGEHGMIGGQILDLENEKNAPDSERLERTCLMKTAYLLKAAAVIGAMVGSADDEMIDRMGKYALNIGLAFQIFDDILDVEGVEEKIGKPVGSDKENHKITYVTLFSAEKAHEMAIERAELAKRELSCMNIQSSWLYELADMVVDRDK